MKAILLICLLFSVGRLGAGAQVINDPLFDYYQMITKPGFFYQNSASDFAYSPPTEVICFEANFTESKHKSFFITDGGQKLGPRGKYAWTVYVPLDSGGYHMIPNALDDIQAGADGPAYIGFIEQLKRYGIVEGDRDSVTAFYVEDGSIQSRVLDDKRGHSNDTYYPQYFGHHPENRHVRIYTLAQLTQKYGK